MDSNIVRGTCILMCPDQEIEMRQREGLIHVLEARRDGGGRGTRLTADRRKMVKMYTRSAAGKDLLQPDLLRPPPILRRTINYLLSSVVAESETPWTTVYHFVEDRLRAINQDMVVQQIPPHMSTNILEPIVRFYAYASYRLCEEPIDNFDPHLNSTQLNNSLKHLLVCYDSDEKQDEISVTRDQMEALYGLLHLGNVEALYRLLSIKSHSGSQSRTVLKMSLAHFCNDYVTVFRQLRHLSPLLCCVAALHVPQIRRKTLSVMNSAYSSKNLRYSLSKLTSLLLFANDEDAAEECKYYGLSVDEDGVHFLKGTFDNSTKERPPKKFKFLDENLTNISLPDILLCVDPDS
ncbi:SAC3 domain-containing protein 1 isoform X1 [Macrosteles quadrilineatus]|uniref:SAC3 domain-containing protein 1 isoform X1 n=1 Tax=Macrosteles quadrilineatus TaxID=74068 RepID=UPI0023E2CAA1|nr:SAC3 domain-containing protein 1 isoform X1 [Macrosteles quadrilineatus]